MIRKSTWYISLCIAILTIVSTISYAQASFMSRLHATAYSPLFATYAAAKSRSEFTLDEGYHFTYYDTSQGVDFTTDKEGNLDLGFKKGQDWVFRITDLYRQPVITSSYPDMVTFYFYPFRDVLVNASFFVYSSHDAIENLTLKNTGNRRIHFQLVPFLNNTYRDYSNVTLHRNQNAITFSHREIPDGWVLSHPTIPYVDPVRDVFLISRKPNRMESFRSYGLGKAAAPLQINLKKKPEYVIQGSLTHFDGSPVTHPSDISIMATLNGDRSKVLTQKAPRWGNSDPNVTRYGTYSLELGNFGILKNGDSYSIRFFDRKTGESAIVRGVVQNLTSNHIVKDNVQFTKGKGTRPPAGLRLTGSGNNPEISLIWKSNVPGERFNIYRRDYRTSGLFDLVSANVRHPFYKDNGVRRDGIYEYLVTTVTGHGQMSNPSNEVSTMSVDSFLAGIQHPDQIRNNANDYCKVIAMPVTINLAPGETKHIRLVRTVGRPDVSYPDLVAEARKMLDINIAHYRKVDNRLYKKIPPISFKNHDMAMLYWNAYNLMQEEMLPPEGQLKYNYYVFSREPQWGWGHGGQVFHESLSMLAYAYMNSVSAMNSQRVYLETQHKNGYINYRTGPYLNETIPYNNELTSSAPLYSWENWQIYKVTRDKTFLKQMYESGKKFYDYFVSHRDSNGDGLCSWGGQAVLESLRDSQVAVWDQVGWPGDFDDLGLNCMLVQEAKSLAKMAKVLGKEKEARKWRKDAQKRSDLINKYMWDPVTGFYYNVSKENHSFTYRKPNDLKRQEIIGFLPLWAGIASKKQAAILIKTLTNPNKFWRKYGVPSLAADDPYYNPQGYWNGPVWVQWNYLIEYGLLKYGYKNIARELVNKVAQNMIARLKTDHTFWEFYSPDTLWGGHHQTYIWAGIIDRMLLDLKSNDRKGEK